MTRIWATHEDQVRGIASFLYGQPCLPRKVGGVDIDGVIDIDEETIILIEMTKRKDLAKIREDVIKLNTAKAAAWVEGGKQARCWCVIEGGVTDAMTKAAAPHHIKVVSVETYAKTFFDFKRYRIARMASPFGSAVDPLTGIRDDTEYVPVKYVVYGTSVEVDADQIAAWLRDAKRIVLTGEYGGGKSRCIREVFRKLSETAVEEMIFPVAIDLRESWGLRRATELVRRHFADVGLEQKSDQAVAALRNDCLTFLLDGFDEIGSQAWSNDSKKLRAIRAQALEGVRNLVEATTCGILITGREHYFPSNEEMFVALGFRRENSILLQCKQEFTQEELQDYFDSRHIEVAIPAWLPRRPLICQTITALSPDDLESMFGLGDNEIEFWHHFIDVLCARDARIRGAFDPDTIRGILTHLARLTRTKAANVGPVSLADMQRAFEAVVGQTPVEEASIMLQRLPSLGRLSAESNDRQFVDGYILDGLRAGDVALLASSPEPVLQEVLISKWLNPLDVLGSRILAEHAGVTLSGLIRLAQRSAISNPVLACDIVAALLQMNNQPIDFKGLVVDGGHFIVLDLRLRKVSGLRLSNCTFGSLILPQIAPEATTITSGLAERIYGVSSRSGLPAWISDFSSDSYDSTASVAGIRRIGLSASHEVLVTIIRKTFFQRGSGRKEEALLRGLGKFASTTETDKVIRLLIGEKLLTRFKGSEGWVYAPERTHSGRMKKMMQELNSSDDELWLKTGTI